MPPKPYSDYVADPYASLEVPGASACDVGPQLIVDAATVGGPYGCRDLPMSITVAARRESAYG